VNSTRHLGQPREGNQRGGIRNLRGFVQKHGGIFEPEDFLDAVIVVEPPNPDTRAIRQGKITVLAMLLKPHAGKTELHDLRKRAERDGSPRRIGVVAQYGMARTLRLERTDHNHADNEEGLA
jgi:hypothetical protein